MKVDLSTVIALFLVVYGVFVAITATNLYAAGIVDQRSLEVYQTSGIFISVLSLGYIVYHTVLDRSRNVVSYEFRDRSKDLPAVVLAVAAISFVFVLNQFSSPAESPLVGFLISVLGLVPVLIALAENYFYIGVIGDYVYDATGNKLFASFVVASVALMFHLALKVAYPVYNLPALFLQFFVWAYASFVDRSTFPADVGHLLNNTLAFIL